MHFIPFIFTIFCRPVLVLFGHSLIFNKLYKLIKIQLFILTWIVDVLATAAAFIRMAVHQVSLVCYCSALLSDTVECAIQGEPK